MDELLIMAFIKMLHEKPLSIKRLPNGYCGDGDGVDRSDRCEICAASPWWEVDFKNVGPITIGWRKRVIEINWLSTGRKISGVTDDEVTKSETMVHAYGYSRALEYLTTALHLLRVQKRDETAKENITEGSP